MSIHSGGGMCSGGTRLTGNQFHPLLLSFCSLTGKTGDPIPLGGCPSNELMQDARRNQELLLRPQHPWVLKIWPVPKYTIQKTKTHVEVQVSQTRAAQRTCPADLPVLVSTGNGLT